MDHWQGLKQKSDCGGGGGEVHYGGLWEDSIEWREARHKEWESHPAEQTVGT